MRPMTAALCTVLTLMLGDLPGALPAAADTASGLPTGKRQHKPLNLSKSPAGYRASARRLKDTRQRRAALKLIRALEQAKRHQRRGLEGSHRLQRGRKGRTFQREESDLGFLRERARRAGKGGNDVAMEELTIAHEGLSLVKGAYGGLRRALGMRTNCVRKCEAAKRRCEAACRKRQGCDCIVAASDCLLTEIQARRCSSASYSGLPAKVTGTDLKADGAGR